MDLSKLTVRRQRIIDQIGREGKVRVSELSKAFGTSEVTIRNDLTELERMGLLDRVPGGALQTLQSYYNMDFQQRKEQHPDEKRSIAALTTSLIQDGETLFINSGTTTYYVSIELKKFRNLKIVTNSLSVAMELGSNPTFQIILLGGNLNSQYQFTYGIDAVTNLSKYKAEKVILSLDGVSAKAGLTTYHAEEAELIRLMIKRSRSTIIVADHSKIGHESFSLLGPIEQADYLVTNPDVDEQFIQEIKALGINIVSGLKN